MPVFLEKIYGLEWLNNLEITVRVKEEKHWGKLIKSSDGYLTVKHINLCFYYLL